MGDKRSETYPSTWNKRQETNHKCYLIYNQWNIVAFTNCVPKDNQPIISPYEQKKNNLFFFWVPFHL
jgi:hypothetical protein